MLAGGENWRVRRQAVGPSLHRKYLATMLDRVFGESALHLNRKLAEAAKAGTPVNIEALFSQLTLDVIGKAVFNYEFDSLEQDSAIIQAVYTALKETESRATDLLPYWKIPLLCQFVPRQRKALAAVEEIRATTEMLIARCKEMVNEEETRAAASSEEYINTEDPSILRFLIASRDEVSAVQLRDDLLGMLVAGHETTASVLTWTIYFLAQNSKQMSKLQVCFGRNDSLRVPEFAKLRHIGLLGTSKLCNLSLTALCRDLCQQSECFKLFLAPCCPG
jgi:carotene epsilon-monooxygenase